MIVRISLIHLEAISRLQSIGIKLIPRKTEQEPYGHLTSANATIDRFSMGYVGKFLRDSNRISSQRYAIVTTYFFHFKLQKFLNLRISFQIARGDHPCHPVI